MVSGFIICGINSFPREEDEYETIQSLNSSSRKSKSSTNNKNPYSDRGLDKFSALLTQLEEKKQQVYSQINSHEISLVRFVYSGDGDFKPIVVKTKPKTSLDHEQKQTNFDHVKSIEAKEEVKTNNDKNEVISSPKKIKKLDFCKNLRIYEWKESQFYLVIVFIMIMVFLVFFGRSFAIMCTSIGWYVIPKFTKNATKSSSNLRIISSKKKDHATQKRISNKKKLNTSEGTKSFKTSNGK